MPSAKLTSYPTYEAEHTDARFTDWLRDSCEPTWSRAADHRFTHELGSGTLSEASFVEYLVQDYAFIEALVSTFGFAVGQAPGLPAKRPLIQFLETVTSDENDYFLRAFDALDVPESRRQNPDRTETTKRFIEHLERAALVGGYEETLAVLVPAEWIYQEWATRIAEEVGSPETTDPPSAGSGLPFYYSEWIDLHAIPEFIEFVNWLRGELDTHGPDLSERRQLRVARLFHRTTELEVEFFDAALSASR